MEIPGNPQPVLKGKVAHETLCGLCQAIPFQRLQNYWKGRHHATFAELVTSSKNGCQLCKFFKSTTLQAYADYLSCSQEEAAEFHERLDNGNGSTDSSDNPWDQRDALEADGANTEVVKCSEQSSESSSYETSFWVAAGCGSLTDDGEQGIMNLMFLRQSITEFYPVKRLCPFVRITCAEGSVPAQRWNLFGRPVPPEHEFALSRQWIDECLARHTQCCQPTQQETPTRLLDLAHPGYGIDLRLVVEPTDACSYATLSHCWGSSKPITLTSETYEEFQTIIRFTKLPKTFQDAVTATRALKIRYLWIDSLCIIQNIPQDWEAQCTKMSQIYKGSVVTIAGAAAADADAGFLGFDDRKRSNFHVDLQITHENIQEEITLSYDDGHFPGSWYSPLAPEPNSPLAKRGWVLQERLLSRRVLYFSSKHMYMECMTNVRFDNCHRPALWDYDQMGVCAKQIFAAPNALPSIVQWLQLIETYGTTTVSKPSDRLPAISGLAFDFNGPQCGRYLAGLWEKDLCMSLSWYVPSREWQQASEKHLSQEYIAPSWSWASTRHEFLFVNKDPDDVFQAEFDIIASHTTLSGLDPFGAVKDGYIFLQARARNAIIQTPKSHKKLKQLYLHTDDESSTFLGFYYTDDAPQLSMSGSKVTILFLGFHAGSHYGEAIALAIEPSGRNASSYKRIGLLRGPFRPEVKLRNYFDAVPRKEYMIY